MMRLIDADFVKQRIYETMSSDYVYSVSRIKNLIDEAPTIDAEPVIKCKDCKFNYANLIPSDDVCQLCVELPISKDFFCARGEKMDEEQE